MSAAEIERLDRGARKLVAVSLFLLAAWVAFDAARSLWERDRPEASPVGIILTTVSIFVMLWLGREKRRAYEEPGKPHAHTLCTSSRYI